MNNFMDNIIYKINIENIYYESTDSSLLISFSILLNPSIRDDPINANLLLDKLNLLFTNDDKNINNRQSILNNLIFYNEPNAISSFLPLKQDFLRKFKIKKKNILFL
jgi:hypothetical protein